MEAFTGRAQSDHEEDKNFVKIAAEKAAEEQFSKLVSHVLQNVQVTGRHYAYTRKKDRNAALGELQSDSEIHSGDEAILKPEDRNSKHPSAGLFHKDGVAERMYDLQESVRQEMQRMDGEVGESEIAKFFKTLKEMKRNKHFHEFQLFHDEAIKKGLS